MRRTVTGAAAALAFALVLAGCGTGDPEPAATVAVSSPAFGDGEAIPAEHTCDGADTPPPLAWEGVPEDAVELALVVTDPDAPGGEYVHWVVAGIDPVAAGLPDGAGTVEGTNDFGEVGWGGPCPPSTDDAHRYVFVLSAADEPLDLAAGVSAGDVREALEGREIARGELVGTYDR